MAATTTAAPVVPVVHASSGSLSNEVTLSAEFTPYQTVDVMAKVAGYVKAIHVDIGDHVSDGEVLATLDVPELQDELAHTNAGLAAAEAGIATAQGALERAKAGANIAHLSYTRIQSVLDKNPGLVPRQEVDVAESRDLEAKAQLASAQSSLEAAQQAQQGARSEKQRAEAMLAYATIRAPFSGVVTQRYANTGSMIQAGTASQTQAMPIIQLAQNSLLRLRFPVPVSNAATIRDGQAVEVRVTTLNKTFPGKIIRYADSVNLATRTMQTEVDVPNPKGELIPGMYAEVRLNMAVAAHALSVPVDAVDGLGSSATSVFTVRDGEVQPVSVTTGVQTATRVQILSGLHADDPVIVGRRSNLTAGEKVQAQTAGYE
ncbi:efflux RND transporter periplasmic adaptor subunit [Acidipila sp. EB88]|nr:efflux RND transporter periplasmic adaptor subunit [Acidipila sp. EB88]